VAAVDGLELPAVEVVLGLGVELLVVGVPKLVVAGVPGRGGQVAVLVDVQSEQVEDVLVVEAAALEPDELEVQPAGDEGQEPGDGDLQQQQPALGLEQGGREQGGQDGADQQGPLPGPAAALGLAQPAVAGRDGGFLAAFEDKIGVHEASSPHHSGRQRRLARS
jgi:hypothetical protein